MNVNLEELAFAIHSNAVDKGFWEPNTPDNHTVFYLKQLAMIHSEVSETLEAIRKEKGEDVVVEEMADILIRLLDLWAGMQRDGAVSTLLTEALLEKVAINTDRPRLHGVLA
jgi:NTP pyrophosphatase (non-canonical NTP hydrolase)